VDGLPDPVDGLPDPVDDPPPPASQPPGPAEGSPGERTSRRSPLGIRHDDSVHFFRLGRFATSAQSIHLERRHVFECSIVILMVAL